MNKLFNNKLIIINLLWLLSPAHWVQADPEKIERLDAVAKKSDESLSPNSLKMLTFEFDPSEELQAWLKSNGDWKSKVGCNTKAYCAVLIKWVYV